MGEHLRMEKDRFANRVTLGECAGSCSIGRSQKKWIDTMKDRSEWQGFVRGNA